MVYTSSLITYGRGTGVVVETGMDTEVGNIAGMLNNEDDFDTPLKRKLAAVGKTLSIVRSNCMCSDIFNRTFIQKTNIATIYDSNKFSNINYTRRTSCNSNNSYGTWSKTYGKGKRIS